MLETLEKKEHVLQKKISVEVEKAKDYTKMKNKKGMRFYHFYNFWDNLLVILIKILFRSCSFI